MEKAHKPDEQLAERYFLGELSDDEAEAYEAHYFDCPRCAEYVAEEMTMLESGRAVALADRKPAAVTNVTTIAAARKRKREWLPLAAAAALVVAIGVPMLLRGPAQPEAGMVTLLDEQIPHLQFSLDRSEAVPPLSLKAGAPGRFWVTVPPADVPGVVELSVRKAGTNETVARPERLTDKKLNSPFLLLLEPLPAGSYEVVIEGVREDGNRSTIASRLIEVRR